jgi:ribonuclease HII
VDLEGRSLADIRARLAQDLTPKAEGRLLAALRRDPRAGARALADTIERRRRERRTERRRLASLFALRARLLAEGARFVAGVDEVGVGPLAGPVVAAAVVLPGDVDLPGLDDSKRVPRSARERLDAAIRAQALAVSIAEVAVRDVDRLNVLGATLEAMRNAVAGLVVAPDHVLVDGRTIPDIEAPQTRIVGGDARDGSIAAASIVAKVYRDGRMRELDAVHPGYGFARHKGYGTRDHIDALERLGPCPEHRRSFAPVAQRSLFS